jgi:2-dehydro-3-deoxyphosphogluconate aldolase/(4S)-4-hydroxy-2-oxoglutarate aldolase
MNLATTWLQQLQTCPAIAIIRAPSRQLGYQLSKCAIAAGLTQIEITWNSAEPASLVSDLRAHFPHCAIGVGTILTQGQLREAIAAGAQFAFAPHTQPELIHLAHQHALPMVPGAMTPTEIVTAWQMGATAVKVFPIHPLGGVQYLRAIAAPLDTIPLIPTGGVTLADAVAYLQAGAIAIGLSGQLFPSDWVQTGQWQRLESHLAQFRSILPR